MSAPRAIAPLLHRLHVFVRNVSAYGVSHPAALTSADEVCAAATVAGAPLSLQFVAGGVFCDRILVPLDMETFSRGREVARWLARIRIEELTFLENCRPEELLRFAEVVAVADRGEADALRLSSIAWQELGEARWGGEGEAVDLETFAIAQVALAIAESEKIADSPAPWPWSSGMSVVRRLERARSHHRAATDRALEIAPGAWTVRRRAVAAASTALVLLGDVRASAATQRVAAHATVVAALSGYDDDGGVEFSMAVARGFARVTTELVAGRTGIEPHRMLVIASLSTAARAVGSAPSPLAVVEVVRLAYELERGRRSRGVAFHLERIDLLARIANAPDIDPRWLGLLLVTAGALPVGCRVRLADERVAIVMGPGAPGEPFRPEVMVAGRRFIPEAPVALHTKRRAGAPA